MYDKHNRLSTSGIVFSLICAACVGLHVNLNKLVMGEVQPFLALAYMTLCSFCFSTIPFFARGRLPSISRGTPPRSTFYALCHSVLATGGMIFTWTGLQRLNPTVASFVGRFEVVVSVMSAVWFLNERLTASKMFGFFLGIGGVLILSYPGSDNLDLALESSEQIGVIWILMGACCYGACEVFSVKSVKHMSVIEFVLLRSLTSFMLISILVLCTQPTFSVSRSNFFILMVAALLGPYLGRYLFMMSVARIPLTISVGLNQTQPLFVALFSSMLAMGLPTDQQWLGGSIILIGCLHLIGFKNIFRFKAK